MNIVNNICIIPARGGSKGIPGKNVKKFGGKPLLAWTIEDAICSRCIDKIVVSTDDEKIAKVAIDYGVDVHERSEKNAGDDIHAVYAILECLDFYEENEIEIKYVTMLLATSPLRKSTDIDSAFDLFFDCDSVISVVDFEKPISSLRYLDKNNIITPIQNVDLFEVQRQDVKKQLFEVNGSIYISTVEHLRRTASFHKGRVKGYVMKRNFSIDINTYNDWEMAEAMLYGQIGVF